MLPFNNFLEVIDTLFSQDNIAVRKMTLELLAEKLQTLDQSDVDVEVSV